MTDEYLTISNQIGEGFYSDHRSKFLAFAHHVTTEAEIKEILQNYKKKYYDARHCCYAYVLGVNSDVFRANDDGEPDGTAGRPILGQINSKQLTDILIVVIRYFGGIKLGTSGLLIAYRTAAAYALDSAIIERKFIEEEITYNFAYPLMNGVMKIVKDMQPRIIDQVFDTTCSITLSIRQSEAEALRKKLKSISFA
ncbi:MAG: YigZ family protein [Prevotella sp.]